MYEQLYAAWRREIEDATLGGLSPDFYVKIADYLGHIKEAQSKPVEKKTVKTSLLEHEAKNVERMLGELLDMRYRKILKTVTRLHKAPVELLTTEEAKMCEGFVGFSEAYRSFARNLKQGEQTQIPQMPQTQQVPQQEQIPTVKLIIKPEAHVTHKRLTLRFTKNIPAIMGADMKSYGPFQAEDVASLPSLNAQILVKQGLAVLVEVS
jgi:DNA replication factor GINS